jgi:hypothetical protein
VRLARVLGLVILALTVAACGVGQSVPPTTQTGFRPVIAGGWQLMVPDSWTVLYNPPPCPVGSPPGEVLVDSHPGVFHCPLLTAPGPTTLVSLQSMPIGAHGFVFGHPITINGILLYPFATRSKGASSFRLARSGREISVSGPLGQRVLHTLTKVFHSGSK